MLGDFVIGQRPNFFLANWSASAGCELPYALWHCSAQIFFFYLEVYDLILQIVFWVVYKSPRGGAAKPQVPLWSNYGSYYLDYGMLRINMTVGISVAVGLIFIPSQLEISHVLNGTTPRIEFKIENEYLGKKCIFVVKFQRGYREVVHYEYFVVTIPV